MSFVHYSQPTLLELQKKARASTEKAGKRGRAMNPVVIQGRTIAKSYWGKAWCDTIESYADYSSRLDRGKRYVRGGTVIDLQIKKGVVKALVQGRRVRPYKVTIEIQPISQTRLNKIKKVCEKRITDIEALMNGDFPEDLQELFLNKEGLFPGPRQISFDCSCPDWARLCKHVAAVLYGIGAMFDENPFLFFELRGIDVNSLVSEALVNHVDQMLSHAHVHTKRMIDDKDISDIFQLDVK